MRRLLPIAFLALLACHDAKRENPFDPTLTPAPQLQVALNDSTGSATLTWTPYEGEAPFAAYWVLRNAVESSRVDTLTTITDVAITAFLDTSLTQDTAYEYRLSTLNSAGFENPSDKQSTSGYTIGAVSLLALETDIEVGTITLRWSRYRDPGFEGYQILRRVSGSTDEEVLIEFDAVSDTVFTDPTPRHGVNYAFRVIVKAAGEVLGSNPRENRLSFEPVQLQPPVFDSATATATLSWTPYRGARFRAYEIQRRTSVGGTEVIDIVEEIADSAATEYLDEGLLGNTEYFYRIVVLTERDERIPGNEQSGAFHRLVDTWALAAEIEPWTRLNSEGDRISLLMIRDGFDAIDLLTFDTSGTLLATAESFGFAPASEQAMATALAADGRRFIALANGGNRTGFDADQGRREDWDFVVVAQAPGGEMIWREHPLSTEDLPQFTDEAQQRVLGEIGLAGPGVFGFVRVTDQGQELFADDFTGFPQTNSNRLWRGCRLSGLDLFRPWETNGSRLVQADIGTATRSDSTWRDFRLVVEVTTHTTKQFIHPAIWIGGDTSSKYAVSLDLFEQEVALEWSFSPPEGVDLPSQTVPLVRESFPNIESLAYQVSLEVANGEVRASVSDASIAGGLGTRAREFPWCSMALIGDVSALTVYNRAFILDGDDELRQLATLPGGGVSEMRSWEDGRERPWVGVCQPESDKVRIGRLVSGQEAIWPDFLQSDIGPRLEGTELDRLDYPISFAVGPDGRIYILDAANARIVVVDSGRQFITQWGTFGSGEGQFDFGQGATRSAGDPGFTGSIAVDDEGFVYVAEGSNRRIQKFEP